jgi:hypothetical protein
MIDYQRMSADLVARLADVLGDLADAQAEKPGELPRGTETGLAIGVVRTEVRRFFADQISPPGPCGRPGCGHPADWHRLDDAQNVGPSDPGALFRCLGYDPGQDGPPQRICWCPDMVRMPDPRPHGWTGKWPPVCDVCGHRHTPGERCADHVWKDACAYDADRYCGRPQLAPRETP